MQSGLSYVLICVIVAGLVTVILLLYFRIIPTFPDQSSSGVNELQNYNGPNTYFEHYPLDNYMFNLDPLTKNTVYNFLVYDINECAVFCSTKTTDTYLCSSFIIEEIVNGEDWNATYICYPNPNVLILDSKVLNLTNQYNYLPIAARAINVSTIFNNFSDVTKYCETVMDCNSVIQIGDENDLYLAGNTAKYRTLYYEKIF